MPDLERQAAPAGDEDQVTVESRVACRRCVRPVRVDSSRGVRLMRSRVLLSLIVLKKQAANEERSSLSLVPSKNSAGLRGAATRDASGSGSVQVSAGFGFSGFEFGVGFSPTVFKLGFGFGFGFWFPPVDIQWISEINYLELKLMLYNMLMITCLLRLLNLLKVDS